MYVCFLHLPTDFTEVLSGDAFWIKTSLASVVFILPELTKLVGSRTVPPATLVGGGGNLSRLD
jgi:hypothetical protein